MHVEFILKAFEFAQMDLSNVALANRNAPFDDMIYLSSSLDYNESYQRKAGVIEDNDWQRTIEVQKQWTNFFDWLYELLDSEEDWQINLERPAIRKVDVKIGSKAQNGRLSCTATLRSTTRDVTGSYGKLINGTNKTQRIVLPAGVDIFLQAARGYPSNSFLICPNCKRKFFNPSKKRLMKYCSSSCQKTASVKRVYAKRKKASEKESED